MSEIDVWEILTEIGKILWFFVGKLYGGIIWLYVTLIPYLGEAGSLIIVFVVLFFPSFLVFSWSIAKSQAGLENFFSSVTSAALKFFGVFLVTVIILFVLSST